jgi:DNA-directed RNA polymerase specialized sigma subunit
LLLQLLLELYNPLVVTRANRAAKQAPSADLRELMAAARRGLLQAAAKFDASRTAGSSSSSSSARLGLLADGYIRNALRNVLQEVGLKQQQQQQQQRRRQGSGSGSGSECVHMGCAACASAACTVSYASMAAAGALDVVGL